MKKLLVSAAVLMLLAPPAFAQLKLPRVSPKGSVMQTVGLTDVTINYNRPGVKGRTIWGDLVPYDKVWRTGANEATTITFSRDVTINGQPLPAGTYSLHTVPGKGSWAVIFNRKAELWGSYDYDPAQDALRVDVKPVAGSHVEWMTFSFPDVRTESAQVELAWEKLRVSFTIGTDTVKQALDDIHKALAGEVKEWTVPYGAASFAFSSDLDNKAEAMAWIDRSLALKEVFWNLRLKAQMLAKEGRLKDAVAVGEKAVAVGKTDEDAAEEVPKLEKEIAGWKSGK